MHWHIMLLANIDVRPDEVNDIWSLRVIFSVLIPFLKPCFIKSNYFFWFSLLSASRMDAPAPCSLSATRRFAISSLRTVIQGMLWSPRLRRGAPAYKSNLLDVFFEKVK
jgi:hypothetical protein